MIQHTPTPGPLLQLSQEENKSLQTYAEQTWQNLEGNDLGGYSGINRPFYLVRAFTQVIEKYGCRDTGYMHSKTTLELHDETAAERDMLKLQWTGMKDEIRLLQEKLQRALNQTNIEAERAGNALNDAEKAEAQRDTLLGALKMGQRFALSVRTSQAEMAKYKGTPDEDSVFDQLRGCEDGLINFFESDMLKSAIASVEKQS